MGFLDNAGLTHLWGKVKTALSLKMDAATYDPKGKARDVFGYVDSAVAAIPVLDVSGQIGTHNTSGTAHQDIRTALDGKAPATHSHTQSDITGLIDALALSKPYIVRFAAADWVVNGSSRTITIPASTHGLSGSAVMCQAYALRDGSYMPGVWAAMETYAVLSANKNLVLHLSERTGYAGMAVITAAAP